MGFPEQLKIARLNMNYTQQQVADLMGITKSTYCGYETGKRQPDVAKIKQLAKILQTSGDTLLETGYDPQETAENKESTPMPSQNGTEALTVEEVVAAFVSAGIVPAGKDLSDEDLRFLTVIIDAISQWFND